MSTRSIIAVKNGEDIHSIWCRSDGYPKGEGTVGEVLNRHYKSKEKVLELIRLGDIDQLCPEVEDTKTFPEGDTFLSTYQIIYQHNRKSAEYFYLFDVERQIWLFTELYSVRVLSMGNFKTPEKILDNHINGVVCGDPLTYQHGKLTKGSRVLIYRLDSQQFQLLCDECEAEMTVGDKEISMMDSLAPEDCRCPELTHEELEGRWHDAVVDYENGGVDKLRSPIRR